jgi:polyprenyl-phospho-N-acetylgalactosaminyl synthase
MPDIAILIPAYNEEKKIRSVLDKLIKFNIYVVNDGSTDKTLEIIKKYKNINIINNKINYGYEYSILKGFNIILKKNFKYIMTLDADGEHKLNKVDYFHNFALKSNVDLIVGNRKKLNRISEKILSFFFKLKFKINDPLSGFKLYKTTALKKILKNIKKDNTFLVKIVYFFFKKKLLVINLNISVKKRTGSRVGNNFCINLKILKLLRYCF